MMIFESAHSTRLRSSRIIAIPTGNRQKAVKFSEENPADGYFIQKYAHDRIIINERRFVSSLIISPDKVVEDWQPRTIDTLALAHFDTMLALEPEIALIGTGQKLVFPPLEIYSSMIDNGIGLEIMDTGAACRTYNILMSEGRRVVAGLIF